MTTMVTTEAVNTSDQEERRLRRHAEAEESLKVLEGVKADMLDLQRSIALYGLRCSCPCHGSEVVSHGGGLVDVTDPLL